MHRFMHASLKEHWKIKTWKLHNFLLIISIVFNNTICINIKISFWIYLCIQIFHFLGIYWKKKVSKIWGSSKNIKLTHLAQLTKLAQLSIALFFNKDCDKISNRGIYPVHMSSVIYKDGQQNRRYIEFSTDKIKRLSRRKILVQKKYNGFVILMAGAFAN